MSKNLVIVESPAKAKTIEQFLGKDYKVMSSYGHIRDLGKRSMDIRPGLKFEPPYEIPEDKKKLVAELRKAAKSAETVWLASDEDREGEAIAWHLCEVLGLPPETTRRIVFHEITKEAILNAIANPRTIDLARVDAQQARRVLDRIVGFELSPVLWKKIKPQLSAGRVQSVAVRLICEREQEIDNFKSETFWRVTGLFATPQGKTIRAELSKRLPDRQSAEELLEALKDALYKVEGIRANTVKRQPAPPFTTSTLQQEAGRKLGFPVSLTMSVAQKLYEAGFITYMRTDSLNLSSLARHAIAAEIQSKLGDEYLQPRNFHTHSKGAQEAHEAIRPTYVEKVTVPGTAQEQKLYKLIRLRAIASQMADAVIEKTTVEIKPSTRPEHFTAQGEVIKFDGFMRAYQLDAEQEATTLPPLAIGEELTAEQVTAMMRFTQQPPRYTEATLVRKLEELGIGRPSTYAPTISTIQQRGYVEKGERPGTPREYTVLTLDADKNITDVVRTEAVGAEKGKLIPTDTGKVVNDFLTEHFPDILDYDFTAQMEEKFDQIAEGNREWHDEIVDFYNIFHPGVERADAMRLDHKVGERMLGVDPVSGEPVSVKIGRYGPLVQIGDAQSDTKPRFASLHKDQSVFSITLEEALKLFELPRTLGEYNGKPVKAAIGRFGPYVSGDGVFASIPKEVSPMEITFDEAVALIQEKKEADAKKTIKVFDEEPDLRILNGRWGPYIAKGRKNFKIPKTVTDPSALTLEEVHKLMEADTSAPKKRATKTKS